jgi:hypothetical protein
VSATSAGVVEGFAFNDFCSQCHRVVEHKISLHGEEFLGVCSSCGQKRLMIDINQVHYPEKDLWVTRFKIGNMPSVVAGQLLDVARRARSL